MSIDGRWEVKEDEFWIDTPAELKNETIEFIRK